MAAFLDAVELPVLAETLLSRMKKENSILSIGILQSIEKALQSSVSIIRTVLNSHISINRFPPEVLGLIFGFVLEHHPDYLEDEHSVAVWPGYYVHACALNSVVRTCHHWRNVAFGTPSLWMSIHQAGDSPDPGCMELWRCPESSYRSGVPLDVYMHDMRDASFMHMLSSNSLRIRELTIVNLDKKVPHDNIPDRLRFPAPNLEHLVIGGRDTVTSGESVILFDGHAPQLKMLVLDSVEWIPQNELPNLTCLCVSTFGYTPERHSTSALFALLSRTPRLQQLFLVNIALMDEVGQNTLATIAPVSLTHLRRLLLHNVPPRCVTKFLSCVRLPTAVDTMSVKNRSMNRQDLADTSLLRELARHSIVDGMTSLQFKNDEAFCDCYGSVTFASHPSAVRISERLDLPRRLSAFCSTMPLSGIHELWYDCMFDNESNFAISELLILTGLLDAMPALRKLAINGTTDYLRRCLKLLTTHPLRCPMLAELHVRIACGYQPPSELEDLHAVRAEAGHPLACLVINHDLYDYYPEDLEEMQKVYSTLEARYVPFKDRATMELPDVCREDPPLMHWPKW